MFPTDIFEAVISDHARRMRRLNCFAWMREGISRAMGGRRSRRHDGSS
ncbi:MAG TPA: hypothetical protein VKZ96_07640 [Thermomicrobiales bacterium]|nr:hypothetical protein [Thermomicrobiales bacterium]